MEVSGKLTLVPIPLRVARDFVAHHHRHNLPPRFGSFATGAEVDGELVGVAIAARPVARMLAEDRFSLEVVRVCTDGTRNANSFLYGAVIRIARAMGYRTVYTYTLAEESGASLRAVGFSEDAALAPRESWSTPSRLRFDQPEGELFQMERRPTGAKIRWKKTLAIMDIPAADR